MRKDLIALIDEKFGSIEDVQLFVRATLLDWRYKKYGFHKDERTPLRVAKAANGLGKFLYPSQVTLRNNLQSFKLILSIIVWTS